MDTAAPTRSRSARYRASALQLTAVALALGIVAAVALATGSALGPTSEYAGWQLALRFGWIAAVPIVPIAALTAPGSAFIAVMSAEKGEERRRALTAAVWVAVTWAVGIFGAIWVGVLLMPRSPGG